MISDYSQRLEKVRKKKQSNCIGTALYLTGLQRHDRWADWATVHEMVLSRACTELADPKDGCLISWEYQDVIGGRTVTSLSHLGVVRVGQNISVTHRPGSNQSVIIDEPREEVRKNHSYDKSKDVRVKYYQVNR